MSSSERIRNNEIRALLSMVLARLDSDPKGTDDWTPIVDALKAARRLAGNAWRESFDAEQD